MRTEPLRSEVQLTPAQERFLVDLLEPNKNPRGVWYYPAKQWRTAECLIKYGYVRQEEDGAIRRGYSLTPAGRARATKIADEFVAGERHAV